MYASKNQMNYHRSMHWMKLYDT